MPLKPKTFRPPRAQNAKAYEPPRGSASSRGYGRLWQKVRKMFLVEHPLCMDCEAKGLTTPATEVHHVRSLKGNPGLAYDPANLQALCKMCHNRRRGK